jgi:hypothetical protein
MEKIRNPGRPTRFPIIRGDGCIPEKAPPHNEMMHPWPSMPQMALQDFEICSS